MNSLFLVCLIGAAAIHACLAAVTWASSRHIEGSASQALRACAVANLMLTGNAGCLALSPELVPSALLCTGMLLIAGNAGCSLAAVRRLQGADLTWPVLLGGLAAAAIAQAALMQLASQAQLALAIGQGLAAAWYAMTAWTALRIRRSGAQGALRLLALTAGLAAATFAAWAGGTALSPEVAAQLWTSAAACATVIGGVSLVVLGTSAFLMLAIGELLTTIRENALSDPLTGLLNRRGLQQRIETELSGPNRLPHAPRVGIIVVDIDHFKRINDEFGHDAGDEVLRRCAQRLREQLRAGDILARLGGEEFVALLPRADAAVTDAVAERMRCVMQAQPITLATGTAIGVTISAGTAEGQQAELHYQPDIARADAALYQAKRLGRNRVTRDPASPSHRAADEIRRHG